MPSVPLSTLRTGEGGVVQQLNTVGSMRRRLMDLGFLPGAAVVCVGYSPGGDPAAYGIRGAVIALRRADSAAVLVQPWEVERYDATPPKS